MQTKTSTGSVIGAVILIIIVLSIIGNIFGGSSGPNRFAIEDAVSNTISAGLLNPSGASFSGDSNTSIVDNNDGTYEVEGYVDDTNAFGAKVRNNYKATVTKDGDNYSVTYQLQNAVTGEWQ